MEARLRVLEATMSTLATKSDIAEVKADVYKVQAEVHRVHSDFGKWIVATVVTLAFGFFASTASVVTMLRPPNVPPVAALQPATPVIVYNIPAAPSPPPALPAK